MDENKSPQKNFTQTKSQGSGLALNSIVLDKAIFSNVFEKDIRRIYIYKKSERIAKALHLVAPAFKDTRSIQDRLHTLSVDLIDSATLPIHEARERLSRVLLTLSSILSMVRDSGILSRMNADIINQEVQQLLHDVASYEEQKIAFEELPSLAKLARTPALRIKDTDVSKNNVLDKHVTFYKTQNKGQTSISDTGGKNGRRDSILTILRSKGPSYIKDLSTLIRDVSEKTIQRELQSLVLEGVVTKTGERRWTTYTLSSVSGTES